MAFPHGAMGLSVMYNCAIFLHYLHLEAMTKTKKMIVLHYLELNCICLTHVYMDLIDII